jgi:hypothetical protein
MKSVTLDYDELKPFARLLWSIFTGWDPISGHEEDIIKKMIEDI